MERKQLLILVSVTAGLAVDLAWAQNVTLTATPANLTFTYVVGNALPTAQTVSVKANSGTPTYLTTVTGTNALWLTATPDSGKIPTSLSVRVNPTGMSVGTYSATVSVATATATASIPVTLNITSPLPILTLGANTLTFQSPPVQPAPQTVRLTTSSGAIPFTAAVSGGTWLTVSPVSGVVLPGEQVNLTVTVDASAVVPQATPYAAKVTITATGVAAANKTQNIAVSLTAQSSAPTVTSLWPASAQINSPATTITIRGTNFYVATIAKISGTAAPLASTVLSPSVMLAVIPLSALTTAATLNVLVSNPAPGGDSAALPFQVSSAPVVQAIVSSASNGGIGVSPGELVTLYGANIGPSVTATMADADSDGIVDQALGGVSVSIDGQPAPLLYVSQNQISCQVPYAVSIGTALSVVVTNGSVNSTGTVDIVAAAPGIFTLDGSGLGQSAALNYNATSGLYTLNQSSNPAKIGDIVVLYITGEGDYATLLNPRTGLIVPNSLSPLPQVNTLPVVTIGGAAATVQYAGPLIGSIMGLLQINVTVPAGSTTGVAVPVLVNVGGVASQTGTTLSIHQ